MNGIVWSVDDLLPRCSVVDVSTEWRPFNKETHKDQLRMSAPEDLLLDSSELSTLLIGNNLFGGCVSAMFRSFRIFF